MNESGKITLNVSSATIFKTILIVLLFVVLYYLRGLLLVVLTAVVIASVIEPVSRGLMRYKFPRPLAVICVYALLLVILSLIFYFLIPELISEATQVIATAPKEFNTVDILSHFKQGNLLNNIESLFPKLPATVSTQEILKSLSPYFKGFSGGLLSTLTTFFGGIVSFVLVVVLSFYLAVREEGISDFLKIITPLSKQAYVVGLWKRSQIKIGLWMQGQLLLGVIVAVLIFLGLAVLHVQHALLLAVLAGIFELIPVVGMSIAGIPAVLIALSVSGVTLALLVAGLYLIVQQFEAHLIYPLVVRKVVGVPPLLVIIALVAGADLGGFLGILLSVPISVSLMEYLHDMQEQRNHPDNEASVAKVNIEH